MNLFCHVCECSPEHKDHEYLIVEEMRIYLSLDNPHAYQPDPKEVADFINMEASSAETERQNSVGDSRTGLGNLRLHGSWNMALRAALQRLYDETADYIRINNLGDVHHNQAMKDAKAALALPEAQPTPPAKKNSLDEIAEYLDERGIPFMEPLQSDFCPMAYTTLERVKMLLKLPWFPIESAPKDGKHILAASFAENSVGFGGNPKQSFQVVVHYWSWCDGTHQEEWGWYPSSGCVDSTPAYTHLTHWKPLEELAAQNSPLAAQPTPGWTFVDATKHPHGMPPQYDEVLFSTTYEQVEKGKWNGSESERNRRWQSCEVDSQNDPIFFCDDEVIAWQPLPSPPEPTPTKKENA